MRRVPAKFDYLIIGNGKLASHLSFYFKNLDFSFKTWNRTSGTPDQLSNLLFQARYTLLCISDSDIKTFSENFNDTQTTWVHFSGSLDLPGTLGFHPLMTFSKNIEKPDFYPSIPFVGSESKESFHRVFPQLTNYYKQIPADKKSLYHSLCVLSGNGTTLLWELAIKQFEALGVEKSLVTPYLQKVTENISNETPGKWTGPWYRKDDATIKKHQDVLKETPLQNIYDDLHQLSQEIEA